MARSYSISSPRLLRLYLDGSVYDSNPTGHVESLIRSDIVRGQKDIYDGFRYPNPYDMSYILDDGIYGTWESTYYGRKYLYVNCLRSLTNTANWKYRWLPEIPADASNQAIIKMLEKLKDQKTNLAVAMAEASQVAGMITSNARRIAAALVLAKKGNWRFAFRELRHRPRSGWDVELASRILEFQYGVRPLVSDIYGAMEALANAQYGPQRLGPPFRVIGVVKGGDKSVSNKWTHDGSDGYLPITGHSREYWEVKVSCWYSPKNGILKSASEMGMTNPLAVAWEVLPFSCIVDWVWPASRWLNTLDAAYGLEFRGGTLTKWRQTETTYSGYKSSNPSVGFSQIQSGTFKQRAMNRTVFASSPIPIPPGLKNPVSTEHALNAIALLVSAFNGADFVHERI